MSMQQFCLRWNNHQPNFISVCSSLLHNGTLVDVTLAAEGRQLQAHKIVLSACSSYFQTLFASNPCQHPIVILKDVQYNDLKTMVDFMYYGEVNVSQEQLPHILKTAGMLKIKGLADMPDATASLTKSESKSSSDQTEQIQGCGSGSESIWGSTESQFQHHHLHQQHLQHLHHQLQGQQQQQRRTPSPTTTGTSPLTRRKRLRKSSSGGGISSTEHTSEDQSSIENPTNINLSQMNQVAFSGAQTNLSLNIHAKSIKGSSSTDTENHPLDSSQESIEESSSQHQHHVQQIKPKIEMGTAQQSMPLDVSGSGTETKHEPSSASCSQSQSTHSDTQTTTIIGSKRNRFLIRQPRIKRDSDTINQQSPEIELEPICSRSFLTVPPKIERHASEPAPSMTPSSPHLLSIPQSTPYLVKQHSHPLLSSHSPPPMTASSITQGLGLHRQLSYPISSTISKMETSEPNQTMSTLSVVSVPSSGTLAHTSSMLQYVTTHVKQDPHPVNTVKSDGQSPSVILISDPLSTATSTTEHVSTLRIKSEELQRSSSSPQATRELSLENPRSSHCPVIRPGPALGCNFCWNTIDAHGRILRRKTKYHCPECQTNLCIVPCFQEYHERQANENQSNNENSVPPSTSSSGKNTSLITNLRNYPKTGSI